MEKRGRVGHDGQDDKFRATVSKQAATIRSVKQEETIQKKQKVVMRGQTHERVHLLKAKNVVTSNFLPVRRTTSGQSGS